jgi:hypothetical protein
MTGTAIPAALTPALEGPYSHRPRVAYILRRKPEASAEAFAKGLAEWRREHDNGVGVGAISARAGAAIPDAHDRLVAIFGDFADRVTSIDGYVSLDLESYEPSPEDFDVLFEAAGGCLNALADVVDPTESFAAAGVANLVIPGVGPFSRILMLERKEGLTMQEYYEWWVEHAADERLLNPSRLGYHQLYHHPDLNAIAARVAGTAAWGEGQMAMAYVSSLEDVPPPARYRASEEQLQEYRESVSSKVDFSNVLGSYMREL